VEEVYDQRKLEVVDEIFVPDFTLHDPDLPGAERGPKGVKRIVRTFVDAFSDLEVSLDDEMSSGDKVIARWTARGTQQGELMGIAHTGNRIDVTTIGIWRVADGKIAEAWLDYDAFGIMQQLGLAPRREGAHPDVFRIVITPRGRPSGIRGRLSTRPGLWRALCRVGSPCGPPCSGG
jgi:predicted ester cyclase